MANANTEPNSNVLQHVHHTADPRPGTTFQRDGHAVGSNIKAILGEGISLARTMNNGQMSLYEGPAQSTYGIPFAIDGTASVIEDKVAVWIAGFRDPIKAIFDTSVHRSQKVIFKRKWVKGGQALVVPERAPARTISVAFDQREERLTRHAIALEQNIYLYQRPDDAREDLEMKLEGIRLQLEQALVNIGYERAFSQGVDIVNALQRGNVLGRHGSDAQRAIQADNMYVEMFAGVVSKSEFPFKNLAAAIARASIYTPTGTTREKPAVMLVPPGMVDLPKFTSKSEMSFNVTGLTTDNPRNKVSLPLPNAMEYPDANIRVLVHTPPASYRSGAAYPQVEENEMSNVMSFASYYIESEPFPTDDAQRIAYGEALVERNREGVNVITREATPATVGPCIVTDFKQRSWKKLPSIREFDIRPSSKTGEDIERHECYRWWLRPQMSTLNNSALLCTRPGAETGELLYAYPSAHVSTSQHTGSLILTLDIYYGCAIRHPERLMVLNGIQFNGIVGGHGTNEGTTGEKYEEDEHDLLPFVTETAPWNTEELWKDQGFLQQAKAYQLYDFIEEKDDGRFVVNNEGIKRNNDVPIIFYRGATQMDHPLHGRIARSTNNGHLGVLDHPRNVGVIQGYQVFTELAQAGDVA